MHIEQDPKVNIKAVPIINFSLANKSRKTYFKQLQFAVEDVGFGVSTLISPQVVFIEVQQVFKNVPGFEDPQNLLR